MKKVYHRNNLILIAAVNPSIDILLAIKKMPRQSELNIVKTHEFAGGKGINVARALKFFGISSLVMGFAGGKNAIALKRHLSQEKFFYKFFTATQETRINYSFYYQEALAKRVTNPGPWISRKCQDDFIKAWISALKHAMVVVVSGSLSKGISGSFYARLIREAKRQGKPTILDSSFGGLREGLKAKPFLIKPNREEAEQVLGYRLSSVQKIKQALKDFRKYGIEQIVISLGEDGAAAYDGKDMFFSQKPADIGLHPVGCGDAMVAALAYALSRRHSFKDAFLLGISSSAACAFYRRPGEFKESAFKKAFKSVRIKKQNKNG